MQNFNPVIQAAKVDALFKFVELVGRMVQDAENNIVQTLASNVSALDRRALNGARYFLQQDGTTLQKRLEEHFRDQMERAMRTMYTDLRTGLGNLSADMLTLIDDETVNRQIEVGHLVQRLRDACDENLGRLNIMIAQLHGDHEVRERENPFRPYLLARTLHDVVRTMVRDEDVASFLFEYLSNALAHHLSAYYAELCDVFHAAGIQSQLLARPTALKRYQRAQLAQQDRSAQFNSGANPGAPGSIYQGQRALPENSNPRVMPGLQRLLELMQQAPAGPKGDSGQFSLDVENQNQSEAFQDFVWNIFTPAQASALPTHTVSHPPAPVDSYAAEGGLQINPRPPASKALLSQLNEYQQLAARGEAVSQQISPDQNQLFVLREQIGAEDATKQERVAIDVIAVLFEFMLDDEQIPASLRAQIGRLQIPFLKAAMLEPELLQQARHATRQLLNRMGSAAVGSAPDTLMGRELATEIKRIVKKILDGFDRDVAIFSDCLEEFELFLAKNLRKVDSETTLSVAAMEEAETISVLMQNTSAALSKILTPLAIDQRVVDFILQIWTRVLVRASLQESKAGAGNSMSARYRDILPELVWSVQKKQTPADRNALMRLLPTLVKRLKIGLLMINLPEQECQQALDQLVAVHTHVLRNSDGDTTQNLPTLEGLRQLFSGLVIDPDSTSWTAIAPLQIQSALIETALAERGVSAGLDLKRDSIFSSVSDAKWLAQIQVGASVECRIDGKFQLARLIWIGKHQSLYMFTVDQTSKPMVYSSTSLSKSLHEGSIRLMESAPTFERAVESLLLSAEAMEPKLS